MSKVPHTHDFNKMGLQSLKLVDANDVNVTGPIARKREYHVMPHTHQFPLMEGWASHSLKHKLIKADYSIEKWEQSRWDREDENFLRHLPECTAPDDVDHIMPTKWKPHRTDIESDPRLERVTKLCTTIVNKVVDWTSAVHVERAPKSVADWNRCQVLQQRIQDMLEFLETTLGEAVGMNALKDPSFVRRCWRSMSEEDHASFEDSIEQSAAFYYQQQNNNSTQNFVPNNNQNNNNNNNNDSQTFDYTANQNDGDDEDQFTGEFRPNNYRHNQNPQQNMMMMMMGTGGGGAENGNDNAVASPGRIVRRRNNNNNTNTNNNNQNRRM